MTKIKGTDLVEENVFKNAIKSAEDLLGVLNGIQESLKITLGESKKTAQQPIANIENLKNVEAAIKKIELAYSASLKTREKTKKITAEKTKLEKEAKKVIEAKARSLEIAARKEVEALKKTKKATDEEVISKLKSNAAAKLRRDTLRDNIILNDKEAGTLQKLAAKNRSLAREREKLNLNTEKGKKRLELINKELDKNNLKIQQNSDKLKKQKINVGNYSESIKEAAEASGVFGAILGPLNKIQAILSALTKKNTAANVANTASQKSNTSVVKSNTAVEEVNTGVTVINTTAREIKTGVTVAESAAELANTTEIAINTGAKEVNTTGTVLLTFAQRAYTTAIGLGTKALKLFKVALAGSGIGLIVIALGGLIAFFTRSQEGVDQLAKGFAGLKASADVLIDRFASLGEAIKALFLGDFEKAGKIFTDALKGIGDELGREIKLATQLDELNRKLNREQKIFAAEQASSLTAVKELTLIVKDKLQADLDRLAAVKEISKIEVKVAGRQLELQNQALAGSLDAISANRDKLELDKEQLNFVERLKTGQIEAAEAVKLAADFTLSSAAGEEALFDIVEKIVAQEQARQSLLDKQSTTRKRTAAIVRDIATKEAKGLLQESKLRLVTANDTKLLIKDRVEDFEEASLLEILSYKTQLDANIINTLEFNSRRLSILDKTSKSIAKLNEIEAVNFKKSNDKKRKLLNDISQVEISTEVQRIDNEISLQEEANKVIINLIKEKNKAEKKALIDQANFSKTAVNITAEEEILIEKKLILELEKLENKRVKDVKDVNEKILEESQKLIEERENQHQKDVENFTKNELKKAEIIQRIDNASVDLKVLRINHKLSLQEKADKDTLRLLSERNIAEKQAIEDNAFFLLTNDNLTTEQRELINAKLIIDLEKLENKRVKDVKDVNEKIIEDDKKTSEAREKETAKALNNQFSLLKQASQKKSNERQKEIDEEISQSEKRENDLRALAQAGSESATENLAFEQRKQAELQRQKANEARKAENQALALGAIESYSAKVASGDKNAVGSTLVELAQLKIAVAALDFFYDGADDIGKVKNPLDSKGGRIIVAHDNEQIWSVKDRNDVNFRTRQETKDIIQDFDSGDLKYTQPSMLVPFSPPTMSNNHDLINGFDRMNKSINDLPRRIGDEMPKHSYDYDAFEKAIIHKLERKNRLEKTHYKVALR